MRRQETFTGPWHRSAGPKPRHALFAIGSTLFDIDKWPSVPAGN
jgi:hypothetical protein